MDGLNIHFVHKYIMQINGDDFTTQLYAAVCNLYPTMSVRKFSQILGMSGGYYNSIKAQGLALSTGALMNLLITLEAKAIIAANERMKAEMRQIQNQINSELVKRFLNMIDNDASVIDELIKQHSTAGLHAANNSAMPLPFSITRY